MRSGSSTVQGYTAQAGVGGQRHEVLVDEGVPRVHGDVAAGRGLGHHGLGVGHVEGQQPGRASRAGARGPPRWWRG